MYLDILCSKQLKPRQSGQRNSAVGFFMIVSGHPAFMLPLTGFTGTSSSLRHVLSFSFFTLLKERAVDLHFPVLGESQSLHERILPTTSGLEACRKQNSSKWFLIDSLEILLTCKHKFGSRGPLSLKSPKYVFLFSCSFVLGVSLQCENNDRLSSLPCCRLNDGL